MMCLTINCQYSGRMNIVKHCIFICVKCVPWHVFQYWCHFVSSFYICWRTFAINCHWLYVMSSNSKCLASQIYFIPAVSAPSVAHISTASWVFRWCLLQNSMCFSILCLGLLVILNACTNWHLFLTGSMHLFAQPLQKAFAVTTFTPVSSCA